MADVKDVFLFFSLALPALSLSLSLFRYYSCFFFFSSTQIRGMASTAQFTSCQHKVMFVERKGIQGERDGHPELQRAAFLRGKKGGKKGNKKPPARLSPFESAVLQPSVFDCWIFLFALFIFNSSDDVV